MLVQVQPPDLSDRNPGGFVCSAALPRACFFREECWAAFILLTRGEEIDSHFLKMLGQARKLYTIHAPIAQLVEQRTFNPMAGQYDRSWVRAPLGALFSNDSL